MNGLPPHSKHLGFIIANNDEEFLVAWRRRPGSYGNAWTSFPDLAHLFPSPELASNVIKVMDFYSKLWVLSLFELPDGQIFVGSNDEKKPEWLPILE
jgi:hypothetical protein